MSDTDSAAEKAGTRFPFVNLEKAVDRARALFSADERGREMAITGAFGVWEYSEKSSGGFQTIAALKMYGLLKDSDGGDSRKVGLTEDALRYFRDEREDEKVKLLRQFALRPKLIASLWKDWGAAPPADTIARSHLKAERGLHDQGARSLLAIYKDNLEFAQLKGSDKSMEAEKKPDSSSVTEVFKDFFGPKSTPQAARPEARKVETMDGERIVFAEESAPGQTLRLIASGEMDEFLLDALDDYVKRQRKRLDIPRAKPKGEAAN